MDSFGLIHNQKVHGVLNNLSCVGYVYPDWENAIETVAYAQGWQIETIEDAFVAYGNANNFDVGNYEEVFDDVTEVEEYYNDILDAINNHTTFASLASPLSTIRTNASSNLSCFDAAFIRGAVSVALHSGNFWIPVASGGTYDGDICGFGMSKACRDHAAVCDVAGFAWAMAELGLGLVVPEANILIFGMIVEYAATASIIAGSVCNNGPSSSGGGSW